MSRDYGSGLFPEHAKLLDDSGIDVDVARERGYVTADRKTQLEQRGFGASQRQVPALVIPLHRVDGSPAGFQIRPNVPRSGSDGKPVKYETPAKQSLVVDVHPRIRERVQSTATPLFITEGVRKADAAITAGLTCVALLGVWNWRGRREDGSALVLPDWEYIPLAGRQVFVVFDSDVMLKPQVHDALKRLKAFLEFKRAEVAVIYLPGGAGASKVGLDDFLAAGHSVDDLMTLASTEIVAPESADKPESFDDVPDESGAQMLDDVAGFVRRFVVLPSDHELVAIVLWIAHTWAIGAFESTPRLNLSSPEKQCGKTRTLEVIELLSRKARHSVNMSAAYLFRMIEDVEPTLLIDEVDTIFNPKLGAANEDLRGLINAGHRRGATVGRIVGEGAAMAPKDFPVFCPVALAGIGKLPDTVHDRSVIIGLRRRAPGEEVDQFRVREVLPVAHGLARRLAAWATRQHEVMRDCRPAMPPGIVDRPADVWEPLIVVADAAGGAWPQLARDACVYLNQVRADGDDTFGVKLLSDIRDVFGDDDKLASETLCDRLAGIDEAPWANIRGHRIDPRKLASYLKRYSISSKTVRIGAVTPKGFEAEQFHDAWQRYLPSREANPPTPEIGATSATTATTQVSRVADNQRVADASATPDPAATRVSSDVAHVADVAGSDGVAPKRVVGGRDRVSL